MVSIISEIFWGNRSCKRALFARLKRVVIGESTHGCSYVCWWKYVAAMARKTERKMKRRAKKKNERWNAMEEKSFGDWDTFPFRWEGKEYFSEERDSVLMWITLQSHHGKIELVFCICMSLNPNFQGAHHKNFPKPLDSTSRADIKKEL